MSISQENPTALLLEEIGPEDYTVRQVYAFYGLAMYDSQCIEAQLVNMLSAGFLKMPKNMTSQLFDRREEQYKAKTFGRLVEEWTETHKDQALNSRLKQAVKTRNFLAHRFFNERAAQFALQDCRAALLVELDQYSQEFKSIDKLLVEMQISFSSQLGITREHIEAERTVMLAEALKAHQSR